MNLDKITSILLNTGLIFASCGVLCEVKINKNTLSKCLKTNFTIASVLFMSSSAINIYSKIKH